MLDAVETAARSLGLGGRRVLVAVSGGLDSTVLLHALVALRPRLGHDVCVGHVNHGLRVEADGEQALVEGAARALGVVFASRRVDPEALRRDAVSRTRPTLQEAARRCRYDALADLAKELAADLVATAHHLDDQAETVLLRLLRGAGPDALGGIPERAAGGRVVRPLLDVPRADIERFARERGLTWVEDPSNRDPRYARARLRGGGLDALASEINPGWLRAVGRLAEAQRRDAEWIEEVVGETVAELTSEQEDGLWIRGEAFRALPEALARRVVRHLLRARGAGRDVSRTHLDRMVSLLRDGRLGSTLELPGGLRLIRERAGCRLLGPPGRAASAC